MAVILGVEEKEGGSFGAEGFYSQRGWSRWRRA
jgi:hypothetical protein